MLAYAVPPKKISAVLYSISKDDLFKTLNHFPEYGIEVY